MFALAFLLLYYLGSWLRRWGRETLVSNRPHGQNS